MSASREKQNRQEQLSSGWVDPKTAREAQQRKEEKRSNILYGIIAIVFVIVAVAAIINRSNIIPRMTTAATIDGEKYNAAEVSVYYQNTYSTFYSNYYYYIMLGYLSLDTSTALSEQTLSDTDASVLGVELEDGETMTWQDYFIDAALDQMATVQAALKRADEEGFVYPDSVQTQYDEQMDSLESTASASGLTVSQYLRNRFGSAMTKGVYEKQLKRMLQYSAYASAYQDSLTYDEATLEATYAADPSVYDKASYAYVSISGAAESTTDADGNTVDPTDEESAAALEAAKTAADEMLAAYRAGEDLETLGGDNYVSNDSASYYSGVLLDWVFDEDRQAGDSDVLENGTTYYVVVFNDRYREDYNTVDVRHILVMVDEDDLDTEADTYEADLQARKDEAKATAESILADWQAGEATEDSFAALANEKSEDGGSNTNGGLYTQIYQDQMVEEFNDWSFDASRKAGDTGIVYGESDSYKGYHVMYFVGTDIPYWQVEVTDDLKSEDFSTWYAELAPDADIQKNASGLKYVD